MDGANISGISVSACDSCQAIHPFDSCRVRERWWPRHLKCLIIGESPGNPGSDYFYTPLPSVGLDQIGVRANLLSGLHAAGLIASVSLEDFREGGFVFDHAIRCTLDIKERITKERQRATRYSSPLAHRAAHLRPLIEEAEKVWVMGHIARDAVVFLCQADYPSMRESLNRTLTPPTQYAKFFFTRYLNRCPDKQSIFRRFSEFLQS
jgi:hypothetical protein